MNLTWSLKLQQLVSHKFSFSAALRFAVGEFDENFSDEMSSAYPSLYSQQPMGYNFELEIKLPSKSSVKLMKVGQKIVSAYDHSYLNLLSEFKSLVPSFERLLSNIADRLSKELGSDWVEAILHLPGDDHFKIKPNSDMITLCRNFKVNCVHRHHNPDLSDIENKQLYGKCSGIHGHEYRVSLFVGNSLNEFSQVASWDELDKIIDEKIIQVFHKTYLNEIIGNTSGELIVAEFYRRLKPSFSQFSFFKLKLRETHKNSFVII